jgi:hypothetical protein
MAEETKNITISKTNSGFPGYLDFDKLRTEGIDYLGRLTGKIWTDYNVHDPGITILEVLCYALLDLGYRTNLPVADIFARNPKDASADNNFFTPAQILANNPLTIIDFRKLLIDIDGIKNAWLEIATDQTDFCRQQPQPDPPPDPTLSAIVLPPREDEASCIDYLNGLYHVYIDLETDIEKKFENKPDEKKNFVDNITTKIKEALMAHRNLCEDFIDVYILCKQEIGVCADIELEDNTDAEQVYISVVEKLIAFFSPSPQFYTLQQLLDKQKSIDEIFSGRPFNVTDSHGFTDTEELEQLTLRKEIHLSDVYHVVLDVPGVKGVNDLLLQSCGNNGITPVNGWKYQLPENHVPEFSLECSGFRFTKNGRPVFVDTKKFEGLFSISFSNNGKIAYKAPSPYLDGTVPQGAYRSDLADYYSIQNEFPRVYGIAEGGLSENASPERKAQAYQLKAWLLFFDQLLANYLAQLKNIRNLFSLSSPGENERHTYFINQLTNVPDHQKLVRFNVGENNDNILGTQGSVLVIPVEKKLLIDLAVQDKLKTFLLEKIEPYTFNTLAEQNIAISQVKNDLYFQQYQIEFITKHNDCVFYYVFTASDEIALICKKYFKDTTAAKEHADTLPYIGSFNENYNSFITTNNSFSFNISLNLLSFSRYLQMIVEDRSLFVKRRQDFLNHLLARFAEQFTDYALLSFGFQDPGQLQASEIKYKENYLVHYDDLSSNRGRAYNYLENEWNTRNISGFEKKVRALGGMDDPDRRSLCNFIVAKYDEQFAVALKMAGTAYFMAEQKADSFEEGLEVARSIFLAMKEYKNYDEPKYILHDKNYSLEIVYGSNQKAVFSEPFDTKEETEETAKRLTEMFVKKEPGSTVFESSYIYIPELKDASGKLVRRSNPSYGSEDEAKSEVMKTILNIDDRELWHYDESGATLGKLYYISFVEDHLSFINVSAFKIDIDNSIIDKPDAFTYELLDKGNTFKFIASNEFQSEQDARQDAYALLALLTNEFSYEIFTDTNDRHGIQIRNLDGIVAVCSNDTGSEEEALRLKYRILSIIHRHLYNIDIDKEANLWKFNYELGYTASNLHYFESVLDYDKKSDAIQAAASFNEIEPHLQLKGGKKGLTLTAQNDEIKPISVLWMSTTGNNSASDIDEKVNKLLEEKKELTRLDKSHTAKDFEASVQLDDKSQQGLYVYRLVDKDNIPAFYSQEFENADNAKPELKKLAKQFKYPKDYLEICMGGAHIIHKLKDDKLNKYWYHYQIRALDTICNSDPGVRKPLVLFESVKGYASEEEAELAFKENYLHILHLASDADNYGDNKTISLNEIFIHENDSWRKSESIVFVPKSTLEECGEDLKNAIKKLVNISLLYPIRKVVFESKEFYKLFFPCKKVEEIDIDSCKKEKEKYVYYFVLRSQKEGNTACEEPLEIQKWQSTKYFDTPEAAGKVFNFFLVLLNYAGNYFVECDTCTKEDQNIYHIYIREVLAEGTERFLTEEEAWSDEGVQKFICIAQSEDSFHTYQRKKDCCYAFYVSCRDSIIYHPCKYDTPQRRDAALLKLYQSLKEAKKKKSWQVEETGNGLLLLDGSGESFARTEGVPGNYCLSDSIATLSKNSEDRDHFKEEAGKYVLNDDDHHQLAISVKEDIKLEEWIKLLKTFLCMYPVVKIPGDQTRVDKYCIEIKLPGFNTCKEDIADESPCGCGKKMEEENAECHVAWKSRCCYDNCWEAEQALQTYLKLLQQYEFYQPVFDCVCNAFGITLQFEKISVITNQNISYYDGETDIVNWRNSEIVVINPQCYPSKEDACEAVSRAKKLINSEGLHVVEHILLRPHCNEDCNCRQYGRYCDETGCELQWQLPEDPCSEMKNICFVPGTDPYSFIATIAMPAWPERFRRKESRDLLEHIIYREAPAHILIRILWLAPHDFCCFETKYKKWNRWLALKKTCVDNFSVCDFMEFLFNRNYECLQDCSVCEPCSDKPDERQPCFADNRDTDKENDYLSQINKMYCWQQQNCGEYQYGDCNSQQQVPGNENPDTPVILREAEHQPQPAAFEPAHVRKSKPQAVNARLMRYKKRVESVVNNSKNNPIALKSQTFITDPQPDHERLSKLVTEILQNKPPKVKQLKALTHKQVEDLLENVICYWLDRHCFNGKDIDQIEQLHNEFKKIEKAKIKPGRIFNYWDFSEVKYYEPDLDEDIFRSIFNEK